ncbi:docking protein 1-like isoform X1 [Penaeus chinensis]|uniref:docking protein 1-like isoform X1 n=1 Tax=Penaeus chinensis TaxID=139456 RepID=UPI001FB83A04|nr:docking protein 1-like isoform X1 [Penaeus chinensis]
MADCRSYLVRLPSAMASKLAVNREMLLNLECEHLTLVGLNGIHSWTWNIRHLRKYGYRQDDFHFESGTRCQTGPGYFSFYTPQGKEIFRDLHKMKTQYKLRNCLQPNSLAEKKFPSPRKAGRKFKFPSLLPKKKPKVKKQDRLEEDRKEETPSPRKIGMKFKFLSLFPKRKPKVKKQDRFEEDRKEETNRSSDVSAAYVTILPKTPSVSNSRSTRKRFEASDAWKHFGY